MKRAVLVVACLFLAGCMCLPHTVSGTAVEVEEYKLTYSDGEGKVHHIWFWSFSCPDLARIVHPGQKFTVHFTGDDDDASFGWIKVEEPKP